MLKVLNFIRSNLNLDTASRASRSKQSSLKNSNRLTWHILLRHSFKLDQQSLFIKNQYKKTIIASLFHLSTFGLDSFQQKLVTRLLRTRSFLRFRTSKYLKSPSLKKYLKNLHYIKYIMIGRTEYKASGERLNQNLIKCLKRVPKIEGLLFQFTFDTLDKNIVEKFLRNRRHIKSLAILNQKTYSIYEPDEKAKIMKPSKAPLIKMMNTHELVSLGLSLSDYLLKDMSYFIEFFNSEISFGKLKAFSFNISASQREQADQIVRGCYKFLKKNSQITGLRLNFQNYEPLCDVVLDNFSLKLVEFTNLQHFLFAGMAECTQGIPTLFTSAIGLESVTIILKHGNSTLIPGIAYNSLENLRKLKEFKIKIENVKHYRIYRDIAIFLPKLKNLRTFSWAISDVDCFKEVLIGYLKTLGEALKDLCFITALEIGIESENFKDSDYVSLCKSILHISKLRDLKLKIASCRNVSDEIIIEKADVFLQLKYLKYLSLDFSFRKTLYNTGQENMRNYYINSKGKKIVVDDDTASGKRTLVTKSLGDLFRRKGRLYQFEIEDCAHVVYLS